jgi:hypothetical protein
VKERGLEGRDRKEGRNGSEGRKGSEEKKGDRLIDPKEEARKNRDSIAAGK